MVPIADNTTINPGTGGDVIATDDVAGVKYQRVKVTDGTADSTTAVPAPGAEPASTAAGLVTRPITDDYVVTGTLAAAAATVTATLYGHNTIAFDVRGTFTSAASTLAFESTIDGTNWFTIPFKDIQDEASVTGSVASVTIPNGTVMVKWAVVTGYAGFRIRMVARGGTDSATVVIRANKTPRPDLAMISMVPGLGTEPSVFSTRLITQPLPPSLTKGTQVGRGFEVQQIKDAGRVFHTYYANADTGFIVSPTTEALVTWRRSVDGATATTATSWTVTSGKKLRLTSLMVSGNHTAIATGRFMLRYSTTGAVTTTSPILTGVNYSVAANGYFSHNIALPDGFHLDGTQQFGATIQASAAFAQVSFNLVGFEF